MDFFSVGGASGAALIVFFYYLWGMLVLEVAEFSGFFGTASGFKGSTI